MNTIIAEPSAKDMRVAVNTVAPQNIAAQEREPNDARIHNPELAVIHQAPKNPANLDTNNSSYEAPEWKKKFDRIESLATWVTFAANLIGAPLLQMGISDQAKKRIESLVNTILNLSFTVYGANGVVNGTEKKNIFMVLGFLGEMIFPWFGKLKYTYVLRGLPTGMDQLWVATDPRLEHKYPGGRFSDYSTGFREVSSVLATLMKEFVTNPFKTMFTLKTGGHHAFLSSLGSAVASIGFMLTGVEKIFGNLRDLSGPLFDWAMLISEKPLQKVSGVFFMLESVFDFMARFFSNNWSRVSLNMLSHACGRLALMLYKNSDSVATVKV